MLFAACVSVVQVIAQPDERYEKYCRESDFIREHIFPGGCTTLGCCC
jgi:cyclopropane fatty-acyl-phospholipid synthase-like methyltransferase